MSPVPETAPPPAPPRRDPVTLWRNQRPDQRSIQIGLIGTLLFHVLLFLGTPRTFFVEVAPVPDQYSKEMDLLLQPDEPPPDPMRFVETNPDAPANEPDRTMNFAAQNQQAAQENPRPEDNDIPETQGRDLPSTAIVTGAREEPVFSNPGQQAAQVAEAQEAAEAAQPEAVAPLPGFEKVEGDDEEGIGTNLAEVSPRPRPVEERVEGTENPSEAMAVAMAPSTADGRPSPRPRPRLQNVRPAVLANQPRAASNAGRIAVDAKFSEFGDYLQELIEIVDFQWNRILSDWRTYPTSGSYVVVRFKINSRGEIAEILDVEETAGKQGTYACLNAIQARQPYRPWTKEMVAVLGNEQIITFSFYYW